MLLLSLWQKQILINFKNFSLVSPFSQAPLWGLIRSNLSLWNKCKEYLMQSQAKLIAALEYQTEVKVMAKSKLLSLKGVWLRFTQGIQRLTLTLRMQCFIFLNGFWRQQKGIKRLIFLKIWFTEFKKITLGTFLSFKL